MKIFLKIGFSINYFEVFFLFFFFWGQRESVRGWKSCHMWDLNVRKQEKHLQTTIQKPKRQNNFMSNLFWQPPKTMDFGRLLAGYNRSRFLCSNRHINIIVCFLGVGSGCFKLHNVLMWSWGTEKYRSTNSHPCPPPRNSPMHTLLGNELGYFFSLHWLGALWQLHSAVGRKALPRASPQLQMTHVGKRPFEPDLRSFPKFILTHWFLPL